MTKNDAAMNWNGGTVLILMIFFSSGVFAEDLPYNQDFANFYKENIRGTPVGIKVPPDMGSEVYVTIDKLWGESDQTREALHQKYINQIHEFDPNPEGVTFYDTDAKNMNSFLIESMKRNCPDIASRLKGRMTQLGISEQQANTIVNGFLTNHRTIFDEIPNGNDAFYNALGTADIWKVGENQYTSLKNLANDYVNGIPGSNLPSIGEFTTQRKYITNEEYLSEEGLVGSGEFRSNALFGRKITIDLYTSKGGSEVYLAKALQTIAHEHIHYADRTRFGLAYMSSLLTVVEGRAADGSIYVFKRLEDSYYNDAGLDYVRHLFTKSRMQLASLPDHAPYFAGGSIMNTLRNTYGDYTYATKIAPELMKAKTMDEFLAVLSNMKLPKIIRFINEENGGKVETVNRDWVRTLGGGARNTYTFEEFASLPESARTLSDGTVVNINPATKEITAGGDSMTLGLVDSFEDWTGSGQTGEFSTSSHYRIDIERVEFFDYSDTGPQVHITKTVQRLDDVIGGAGRAVRTWTISDNTGTIVLIEGEETKLSLRLRLIRTVMAGLRKAKVIIPAPVSSGILRSAEVVGGFFHGTLIAVTITAATQGEYKWVFPQALGEGAIFLLSKYTAMTFMRGNLIGTAVTSIGDLAVFTLEEHEERQIKEKFGLQDDSTTSELRAGFERLREAYFSGLQDLLNFLVQKKYRSSRYIEDFLPNAMDESLSKDKTRSEEDKKTLISRIMSKGNYPKNYYGKIIDPIDATMFIDSSVTEYNPSSASAKNLADTLNKGMCELLEDWQKDKELTNVGVYMTEEDMRIAVDTDLMWWVDGLECSRQYLGDQQFCGFGASEVYKDGDKTIVRSDIIIPDETGTASSMSYIEVEKGVPFLQEVRSLLVKKNCEETAKDLQYRVFVKNNYEEDVTCDKGKNKATLKWEIKSGTDCDKDAGYADITSSVCGETAPLIVPVGSDVEAFCTSKDKDHLIKNLYPEKNGPWCVRVTWCGQPEVFKYGGKA